MKKYFKIILPLIATAMVLASCLKEGVMNIDPNQQTERVVTLQFIENGSGTSINSGMQYFSGGALTYDASKDADTADYNVAIGGTVLGSDVSVTVGVDESRILDNYAADSIPYEIMPDSLYDFVSNTAVIPAGSSVGHLQIVFYPSKIDPTKSYMLPVVITDAGGQKISSNFGILYLHVIGNPIAGGYLWEFFRYNNQDGSGDPSTYWKDEPTVFAPVNPTSIKVPTGYYVQPNYLITFKNTGGVLSDFEAVIAPDEIKGAFTDNGITMTLGPTIEVNEDYTRFTVKYTVYNGAAYRNITDIFYR